VRIAYVALHLGRVYIHSGVGVKIRTQMRLWQEMGHETCLFLHTPDISELDWGSQPVALFNYRQQANVLARELSRSAALGDLIRRLQAYRPDIICLRYGLFSYPLQAMYQIAPVAVEINTDDVAEYRTRGIMFYHINRLTRRLILQPARALMPVSHEIARLPENSRFAKPQITLSNGIDLRAFAPLSAPCNPVPVLAFVGSPGRSWHGVDKLLPLAARFPELRFEVIGYLGEEFLDAPPNIRWHGYLPPDQVRRALAQCDVAFGTLALHRKNMQEASSLKVREALAYGLPVILGYEDTDFIGSEFDFLLRLPNTEQNVLDHAEEIRDFAYRMRGVRVEREAIAGRIDQAEKETERLRFFEKLLSPA